MSPNDTITLAKKRVSNSSSLIDWNQLFFIVTNEIFTYKEWKFAQLQYAYVHPANTFLKTFNLVPPASSLGEVTLSKIKSIRVSMNFTGAMPDPLIPAANSTVQLDYEPLQRFMTMYPDQRESGEPSVFTIIKETDFTNGMQIGIYRMPNANAAVFVEGNFQPSFTIDGNPIPVLPTLFHRLIIDGIVHYAAEEAGQSELSKIARRRFDFGIEKMDEWDCRNQKYLVSRKPYDYSPSRIGPLFPGNFPWPYSRR